MIQNRFLRSGLFFFLLASCKHSDRAAKQDQERAALCVGQGYSCEELQASICESDCPIPLPQNFVPDRRPVAVVGFYSGLFDRNPRGVDPHWFDHSDLNPANGIPDAFDWLIAKLDADYDKGFRRIEINLPAGNTQGQYYSQSQFWTLTEWQRQGFQDYVAPWIQGKNAADPTHPVTMSVYMGFKLNDACKLCYFGEASNPSNPECVGTLPSHTPSPSNASDMCVLAQNLLPWLHLGFTEIGFDFAEPADVFPLTQLPEYNGVKFVAEPIPVNYQTGEAHPDKILRLGYYCTLGWIDRYRPFFKTYKPDPEHTELGFLLHSDSGSYAINQSTVNDFVRRNWVGRAGKGDWQDLIRVAYGRGWFPNVAISQLGDLDGDGDVDAEDLDLLMQNFGLSGSYLTRVHGDLNGDFKVDNEDVQLLLTSF